MIFLLIINPVIGKVEVEAVKNVVEDIRSDVDRGNFCFLVLLDHSNAFDCVRT